jgi:hypothetical protein
MESAYEEIGCKKLKCPLIPKQIVPKEVDYSPRDVTLLEFDPDFDSEPFNIVTSWETPEIPKIQVVKHNDEHYNGGC